MIKYGILDDEGRVVRWVWQRPAAGYEFIIVKEKRPRKPPLDLSKFEDALF